MLNQSQLTVQVKNMVLGTIETDADEVLAFIEERVGDYAIDKYQGDSDAAKKDRAELNKADKRMQEAVQDLTNRWMEPLMATLEKLKTGRVLIKKASGEVDKLVKAKEEQEDNDKRNQIAAYWNTLQFDLVPLERVFRLQWLNKGAKLKEVYAEIDDIIKVIYDSIKSIESVGGEDIVVMKSEYLATMDLGAAIRRGETLRNDRARLAQEAARRPVREHTEAIATQQQEIDREAVKVQNDAPVVSIAAQALGIKEEADPLVTKTLEFTAPRSKLLGLMQYMNDNGILFRKIETVDA